MNNNMKNTILAVGMAMFFCTGFGADNGEKETEIRTEKRKAR